MLGSIAARLNAVLGRTRALPAPPAARPFPPGGCVAFVLPVGSSARVNQTDAYVTEIASMRLRAVIPARQLAQRVPVWFVSLDDFLRDPSLAEFGSVGAIVISKLPAPAILQRQEALSALLARAASQTGGVPLYADMPDDLAALGKAVHQPFLARYQKGLGASCTLVVPCQALGERLARDARRGIAVVEDPYENPARAVRTQASSPLRLMWFGNLGQINAAMLEEALANAVGALRDRPLQLELVTRSGAREELDAIGRRLRAAHPDCALHVTAWSLQATEQALERCDFVLIPHETRAEWSTGKSHNRLVTAIRAGRLAIASPIPTYLELADYAWIGDDLAAGLRWALAHPQEAAERVRAGQHAVEQRFAPDQIGRKWAALLGID
ncbi:MAG: hypothetical protein AMJ64_13020 [Betaproteobacteria bacterium SG8_39]|nr:MAG: hypothetical protein AMJ64_13020 [Betaproteobacteria bacterium SG8_39]